MSFAARKAREALVAALVLRVVVDSATVLEALGAEAVGLSSASISVAVVCTAELVALFHCTMARRVGFLAPVF